MKWFKQQSNAIKACIVGGVALVLAAVFVLLSIFVIAPNVHYSRAQRLISTDPAGAHEAFYNMGDFRQSSEMMQQIQTDILASRSEDTVQFDGATWLVLEERDGRMLLLREEVLPSRPFHGAFAEITWENSAMRTYLNGQWLHRVSPNYRERIVQTEVFNRDSRFGMDGGENTQDYVFLLSMGEARLYFANDQARIARAGSSNVFWWLRSPGLQADFAATVSANGSLGITGTPVHGGLATDRYVRPAIWVTV
ncbi:MAG: DUF6273 domain-containing protein [Oscillospiraceae bacterium]|nr:DUF6273 domain-containing protein [Oscillospiraceae bacterium]